MHHIAGNPLSAAGCRQNSAEIGMVIPIDNHSITALAFHILQIILGKADFISSKRERKHIFPLYIALISCPVIDWVNHRFIKRNVPLQLQTDMRQDFTQLPLAGFQGSTFQNHLTNPVSAVGIRVYQITRLYVKRQIYNLFRTPVIIVNSPHNSCPFRHQCVGEIRHTTFLIRKIRLYRLSQSNSDNHLIIINVIINPHHLGQSCGSRTSGEFYHIDISVFFDKVTIYRTIIQSKGMDRFFCLFPDLRSQRIQFPKRNGMPYRSRCGALERFYIIGKHIDNLTLLDHRLNAENFSLYKLL